MNEKNALRNFLIKRFLIILALVGITQFLLNLFYHNIISPWLTEVFALDQLLADANLSGSLALLFQSFLEMFTVAIADLLPGVPGVYLKNSFLRQTEDQLLGQLLENTDSMTAQSARLYSAGLLCSFLGLLILWLLPYIIASVAFAMMVSKKAAALELAEKARQQTYERQRNLLLSDVAHDLKTPMTTVAGYARALADGQVEGEEKQQDYLNTIYHKSMQMSELVSLLFEYVKLDSAGFSLKKEGTNLNELLRENVAELYTDFEQKDMELDIDIPDEPIYASVDSLQFNRAIHNLLVNALKHNPAGTKTGVRLENHTTSIRILIRDTGIKIPEETALHLFEPFVQGDASRNSRSGSGLGLSITEKIISMHGGSITLNQGTLSEYTKEFVITLMKPETEY